MPRVKKPNQEAFGEIVERILQMPITEELKRNFILYAIEVNGDRAIPYLFSGLKPIAAHALWAMYYKGYKSTKPFVKSAKVEGDVMAFSPHAGPYQSLVRMVQDFVYHVPYIQGHGSFGSVIGGPTAGAQRYTGMRLAPISEDVLFYNTKLLDMGTNYLEEDPEPILATWTALLPLLFMTNTGKCMGFGVAAQWSSGNLFEFRDQVQYYLKTGKVDCSKIFPDFPTGGIIINKSEMKSLYETGKGSIKLRGITEIERDTIKILSLPMGFFPDDFMDSIKTLAERSPNIPIKDVAKRCGDDTFLIEVECEPGTAEYVLEVLFRKTCLQTSIADDHKAIVTPDGRPPETITFFDYMKAFVDSNIALVKKEALYNLNEINDRLELVNGLLNALDIIDKIIATIKKSKSMEEAKKAIMAMPKYKFTERQADYIVHTQLGRLANLEQVKLQDEKKDLEKRKAFNEDLRDNYKSQEKYFLKRFNALVDKYGWERKTQLADIEMQDLRVAVEKPASVQRPKKEFMIVLTNNGCLKRVDASKYRQTSEDEKAIKVEGTQKILLVSNKGMMYKVPTNQIDLCMPAASGTPIADLRPEVGDEKILAIYDNSVDIPYIFFVTKEGNGKCGMTDKYLPISKDVGATFCSMKTDTDEIIAIKLLNEDEEIEVTTNQRTVRIEKGIPQGRNGSGRNILRLRRNEEITGVKSVKI